MSVSSAASVPYVPSSFTNTQPGASALVAESSTGTGAVATGSGSGLFSATGQVASSQDIQTYVAETNDLIELSTHIDWAKLTSEVGQAAVTSSQQRLARNFQLTESALIGFAGNQGLSGINFTFDKVSVPLSVPDSQAFVGTETTNATTASAPAAKLGVASIGGTTPPLGAASLALELLQASASSKFDSSGAALTGQNQDFYA